MANVLIRNADDEALARLKERAAQQRKSLEQALRDIIKREGAPSKEETLKRLQDICDMGPPAHADATDLIREDRDR
jgi:plasmid stability protein